MTMTGYPKWKMYAANCKIYIANGQKPNSQRKKENIMTVDENVSASDSFLEPTWSIEDRATMTDEQLRMELEDKPGELSREAKDVIYDALQMLVGASAELQAAHEIKHEGRIFAKRDWYLEEATHDSDTVDPHVLAAEIGRWAVLASENLDEVFKELMIRMNKGIAELDD
jgi:hypothetical protein